MLIVIIGFICACASQKVTDVKVEENRRITGIFTSEDSESFKVTIKGNKYLTYSAFTQASPRGLTLNFPDTGLEKPETIDTSPDHEIISSIEASEIVENKTIKSSVYIALKKKTRYKLIPVGEGVQIFFPKTKAPSKESLEQKEVTPKKVEPEITPIVVPLASWLEDVQVDTLEDNVIVNVRADGVTKDYKSFTLNDPPRIVFDIYNIKSPFTKEQIIAVRSKWVNRIRHYAHPDKVRLVLDTHRAYLNKYATTQAPNGLIILVGSSPGSQSD